MHKLKYKQLLHLPRGKYHDGKGLYISITSSGTGKWSLRYRLDHKSREMGLGTFPEISIVDARQKAEDNRRQILNKIDPIEDKRKQEVLRLCRAFQRAGIFTGIWACCRLRSQGCEESLLRVAPERSALRGPHRLVAWGGPLAASDSVRICVRLFRFHNRPGQRLELLTCQPRPCSPTYTH